MVLKNGPGLGAQRGLHRVDDSGEEATVSTQPVGKGAALNPWTDVPLFSFCLLIERKLDQVNFKILQNFFFQNRVKATNVLE